MGLLHLPLRVKRVFKPLTTITTKDYWPCFIAVLEHYLRRLSRFGVCAVFATDYPARTTEYYSCSPCEWVQCPPTRSLYRKCVSFAQRALQQQRWDLEFTRGQFWANLWTSWSSRPSHFLAFTSSLTTPGSPALDSCQHPPWIAKRRRWLPIYHLFHLCEKHSRFGVVWLGFARWGFVVCHLRLKAPQARFKFDLDL